MLNKYLLAHICNNSENVDYYRINGNDCYYKEKIIGTIEFDPQVDESERLISYNIYFKPSTPVESIGITLTIDKEGNLNNAK